MCSSHDCWGEEKELPAPFGFCSRTNGTSSLQGLIHSGTPIRNEFICWEAKNRPMSTTVWPGRSQKGWLADLSKQVEPFIGIRNPGGEAGLGDRGRKELSVRHDEFETCRISYLTQVLWYITAVSFNGFPWLLGGKKSPGDSQDSEKYGPWILHQICLELFSALLGGLQPHQAFFKFLKYVMPLSTLRPWSILFPLPRRLLSLSLN